MKGKRIIIFSLVFLISFQLATTSFVSMLTGSGTDVDSDTNDANENINFNEISNLELQCEDRNELLQTIEDSPEDSWVKPQSNRKATMNSKICALFNLIENEQYEEAYDKFLHDIKPKLTGLKTDEEPWANGVFNNPWVISPILQEELRNICNTILTDLRELIDHPEPYVDDDIYPPVCIKYSDGNRSVSVAVKATDTDTVVDYGWMGWVEDEGTLS